ncbi:MAG: diguanylate cyclase [Candidatus Atribacteria bacterium]|nr:diguanylate cyclase [Candidatus Atribacteria bacterium]
MKRKALKRGINPIINQKNYRNDLFNSLNNNNFNSEYVHPEVQNTEDNQKNAFDEARKKEIPLRENESNGTQLMDNQIKFYFYKDEEVFQEFTVKSQKYFSNDVVLRDPLTGLWNRVLFEEEIKRLDTERQLPISIIMGDVNGLKLVNDVYGHDYGDDFLVKVAAILRDSCRKEDIIARWGGDEFIILLPKTSQVTAQTVANRISENCQKGKAETIPITISLGIGTKNFPGDQMKEVLKQAEDDMYHKKAIENHLVKDRLFTSLKLKHWKIKQLFHKEGNTQNLLYHQELGKILHLDQQTLNELLSLAALHDIGKITISPHLLLKKEPLTLAEKQILKRIPEISYRILQYFPHTFQIADAALSYCEWWDGSGYPRGLSRENIPIITRISAVVNSYDLMIQPRPYKSPLKLQEAILELRNQSGKQFDPEMVKLFLKIMEGKVG